MPMNRTTTEYWTVHGNFSIPGSVRFFSQEQAISFAEGTYEDDDVTDITIEHTKTIWHRSKRFLNSDILPASDESDTKEM